MADFSGAKRRTGTPSYRTPPPPTNFSPPVRSQSPMSYSSPRPPNFQNYWTSPVPFPGSPNPNPSGSPVQFPQSPNPGPNPSFYHGGSPVQFPQSPNPSFYRGGSESPSLYSNSGRGGRGRSYGGSDGRGRGGYGNERQHFYIKAMVKDPWLKLKPIAGNILVPLGGSGSWLPRSIVGSGAKRVKFGESGSGAGSGGLKLNTMSLAECLALSMEEAGNDEVDFS